MRGQFSLCSSQGAKTRLLANKHCDAAIASLQEFSDSTYKAALIEMCDEVFIYHVLINFQILPTTSMFLLVRSALTQLAPRRCLALSAIRRADQVMPDPLEHTTGLIPSISRFVSN